MALTLRRLTAPTDGSLPAVERIYVEALPAAERKPIAWLRSLPSPEGVSQLIVAERDGAVLGFAILFVPASSDDAALLEYLAVDAAARSAGVGGELFAHAVRIVSRPILVEVERGDPNADRRRAFYRRHGCRELMGLHYVLPLPAAPAMGLMVGGTTSVTRANLARWLSVIYANVYGQAPDDPRIATMASQFEGIQPLPGDG